MPKPTPLSTAALLTAAITAIAPASAVQTPPSVLPNIGSTVDPGLFIQMQLLTSDLLLLGTIHHKPRLLAELADLVPHLPGAGVTHVALEIPSDQQPALDHYMASGQDLDQIWIHPAIDCTAYRLFLTRFQTIPATDRPIIIAMDMPAGQYSTGIDRDQWMADRLINQLDLPGHPRILAIAGNLHMFKELSWAPKVHHGHRSIHHRIKAHRPNVHVVTIGQTIDDVSRRCDFTRVFGDSPVPVALQLDDRFQTWTLGLSTRIAIRPTPAYRLFDGLIVYPREN